VALVGHLSEYSLAEVLRFAEEGKKTGLLTIEQSSVLSPTTNEGQNHIWFQNGRIVAHTKCLGGHELIEMVEKNCRLDEEIGKVLRQQSSYLFKPLGQYLESQGLINSYQLAELFSQQVLQPVIALFTSGDGAFEFDDKVSPLSAEMTGISVSAMEISLRGLRTLQDWQFLDSKLPDAEYGIRRVRHLPATFALESNEKNILDLADGHSTLARIARKCNLSIPEVQKIAFRLTATGLAKEIPLDCLMSDMLDSSGLDSAGLDSAGLDSDEVLPNSHPPVSFPAASVSTKFLTNLVGFLKQK
jgi:Domain of unknown function (DUF4388)